MKFLATLLLPLAALCACSSKNGLSLTTSVSPGSEYESSVVSFIVKNDTAESLTYKDAILYDFKRPEGDFYLAITGKDGKVMSVCHSADYFREPTIRRLDPGKTIDVGEAAELLSSRYCLVPGQTYNVRVVYSSQDRSFQKVIYSSNEVPFVALR